MQTDHEYYMSIALKEARLAPEHGDTPVGAVLVKDNKILSQAHNRREIDNNPVAHAEILALESAGVLLGDWRLSNTVLYVTLEPCPMCACALVQARVAHLIYGADDPGEGAAGSLLNLLQFPGFKHQIRVLGGVCAEESQALLKAFFFERRHEHGATKDFTA